MATIECTFSGTTAGPGLNLFRNSDSPADDDNLGYINFSGEDAGGNETVYASINASIKDVTGGTEDGELDIKCITSGNARSLISIDQSGGGIPDVIINKDNQYTNFIVETANQADALWVQGSSDRVCMNRSASIDATLNMASQSANNQAISFAHHTAKDTAVGSVSTTASNTAFNTSSDYRVKENIVPMENAIDRVKELKPSRFNFIVEPNKTVDGFIAHEAQEVVPESVTGEKDAVREDDPSKIIPQGIDQSKLVPLLCGALQEAISRIEQLESKVAALEG